MDIIFTEKDTIFPLPLYHGTDKRLTRLGTDNVRFLHAQCLRMAPVLMDIFKQQLSLNDFDDVFAFNKVMYSFKEEDSIRVSNMYGRSIHPLNQMIEGNDMYQYDSFCLTSWIEHAIQYTRPASCGGELCDAIYYLVSGIQDMWPGIFSPDKEMQKALNIMSELANNEKEPIVYEIKNARTDYLLLENGNPISGLFGKNLKYGRYTFRYIGPIDFESFDIAWEGSGLSKSK